MRRLSTVALAAWLISAPIVASAAASQGAPPPQAPPATGPHAPLRIFLDCYECDTEYLRQNIVFVDYMRDRTDADLHVLVTTQSTGSGGTSWTIKYIGLGRFQSDDRTLTLATSQTATSDDRRKEFARVFRLGLAGYAVDTAVARELDVTYRPPAQLAVAAPRKDRWNLWAYRVNGNANVNGEQSSAFKSYRLSFSANRLTKNWKMNYSAGGNASRNSFTLGDGRVIKSRSDSWNFNGLAGKTMGPRFSLGGRISASHSSFSNQDRALSVYPGLEFNFFPYTEYERRSFTIWYEAGPNFYDYKELTVFDKLKETVYRQQVDVGFNMRQPFGSINVFSGIGQDLRHPGRYHININGGTDVRLFKGFSFNVFAGYSKIKDQISLVKAGASTEEVLLRLRQLATNYSYNISFGMSYSFGSIFNSVVNPRFNGPGFFF